MKKVIAGLVVLVLAAAGGYYLYSKKSSSDNTGIVTEPVKRGDITSSVSATGRLTAKVSVLVGTEVSGTIRDLTIDYNSVVKKGQVLIRLDQELFRAQVEQAKAKLASAQAGLVELESTRDMNRSEVKTNIEQTEATARKAAADSERNKMLFDKGVIARSDLDNVLKDEAVAMAQYNQALSAKGKYASIDAQIDAAKAAVKEAQAGLNTAETNFGKSIIRAPMDGVVIAKNVEVGQTVAASFNTPTLLEIGDLSVMEVDVSIDEADVGRTAVGQDVEFTVDAFPEKVFKAKLVEIHYAPVEVQNVITYDGIIDVDNPEGLLRPGMTANVNIITSRKKDVLMIPSAALRVKMGTQGKPGRPPEPDMRVVWVMKGDKPVPAYIKTGVTDFTNTEVLSGLKEGDRVVVEGGASGGSGGDSSRRMMRMFH
jgi:HlyD family secretion protein